MAAAVLGFASTASGSEVAAAPAIADGERYVAWPAMSGETVVGDDVDASQKLVTPPEGCWIAALGSGKLLWDCGHQKARSGVVLDLASGVRVELRPRGEEDPTADITYRGVGRRWAEQSFSSYKNEGLLSYVALKADKVRAGPASPRQAVDLDAADIAVRLCSPLRRVRQSNEGAAVEPFYPYFFDGRIGVSVDWRISVQRCGSRRRRILQRCDFCSPVSFGSRRVVWRRTPTELAVYDDRSRRVRCMAVPNDRDDFLTHHAHTRRRLWLTRHVDGQHVVTSVAFPKARCA